MKKLFSILLFAVLILNGMLIPSTTVAAATAVEEKLNIELDKNWTIKFNMFIDPASINNQNVYIVDENGNRTKAKVYLTDVFSTINIEPLEEYKPGTDYELIVTTNIKSISNNNLKEEYKMKFTTKDIKINDSNSANKNSSIDEIFTQENIEEYLNIDELQIEGKNIYFNDYEVKHYLPKTTLNPKINEQIYKIIKTTLENNERENYTNAIFYKKLESDPNDRNHICLITKVSKKYPIRLWGFTFEEEKLNNEGAKIYLQLNILDNGLTKSTYDEYYGDKLTKCLSTLFDDNGQIGDYIVNQYKYMIKMPYEEIEKRISKNNTIVKTEKVINSVKIISEYDRDYNIYFYFKVGEK